MSSIHFTFYKNLSKILGKRGRLHLRLHRPLLRAHPGRVGRVRRGQADERSPPEDEANPGKSEEQQQQRRPQEGGRQDAR